MYTDALFTIFFFALLSLLPLYALDQVIRSFRTEKKTESSKAVATGNAFEGIILSVIFCIMLLGYLFNSQSVAGGDPLYVHQMTGKSIEGYASLSTTYVTTVFAFFFFSLLAYWLLTSKMGLLSPIIYVVCSSLLMVNILFTLVYFTHTGFLLFGDSIYTGGEALLFQFAYGSLSLLYIAKLNDSLKQFHEVQKERNIDYTNYFFRFLSRVSLNYEKIPVLGMLFLFPAMVLIQLFLVLLGQRPDSFIQVFLDTSSYNYSKMPVPPPETVVGDGHYLCTVSATGHKGLVKPMRSGIRHGERIVVNRQLLIANAFENILEQYTPNFHKRIRRFYDTYGYPISRHIQTKRSANIVYLLMKPLEWLFLLVLYTVDRSPENRIHIQYSELRQAPR